MVNTSQDYYIRRGQNLKSYLLKNKEVYTPYLAFNKEGKLFLQNMNAIENELPHKTPNSNPVLQAKNSMKVKVAETNSEICSFAKSYAVDVDNMDLYLAADYKYIDILKMKDSMILSFTTCIYNLLTPFLKDETFKIYGVTEEMLMNMLEEAVIFNGMLGAAAIADLKNSVAGRNIDANLVAINKNVEQFNVLVSYFKSSHPEFVTGYRQSSKLGDPNTHITCAEGKITNAKNGAPIANAAIRFVGTEKQTGTDANGNYQLVKVKSGNYKMQVSAPGYETKTLLVRILCGKMIPVDVAL